jgi:hypothetical protein
MLQNGRVRGVSLTGAMAQGHLDACAGQVREYNVAARLGVLNLAIEPVRALQVRPTRELGCNLGSHTRNANPFGKDCADTRIARCMSGKHIALPL